ncbi:Rv1355c family protein [bacterium]|jgi:molybdopterin/thiamine biosynthesis adenylyltransferase|nr:Rv1355c family protein [bacterium]
MGKKTNQSKCTTDINYIFNVEILDPVSDYKEINILKSKPFIQIIDTITSQTKELLKTQHPNKTNQNKYVETRLTELKKSTDNLEKFGKWVYYPWSNKLIHILNKNDFISVRTDRNQNKITKSEQSLLMKKSIGIIGLSVGGSIALTMAQERICSKLKLADYDEIDLSNLNRLQATIDNLYTNKAVYTARKIKELDPYMDIEVFEKGITKENMSDFFGAGDSKIDLLIEECDSLDIKVQLREKCKKEHVPLIMDTSDKGLIDIERYDIDKSYPFFHGLSKIKDSSELEGLSTEEKVPFILQILGENSISKRLKSSFIEIEETISTWPQLASDVSIGGGTTTNVARRILLDELTTSGRFYVDVDEIISDPPHEPSLSTNINASEIDLSLIEQQITPAYAEKEIQKFYSPSKNKENNCLSKNIAMVLIRHANMAPSGGNCQPWLWYIKGDYIFLFHNKTKSKSFLDYNNYASYLALGAASENLILKAEELGFIADISPFPNKNETIICAFHFKKEKSNNDENKLLSKQIPFRHTNRILNNKEKLPQHTYEKLRDSIKNKTNTNIHFISKKDELDSFKTIYSSGERIRMLNQEMHSNMMNEIRWTSEETQKTCDGIDIETLELSKTDQVGLNICKDWKTLSILESLKLGKGLEKFPKKIISSASAIGVLYTEKISPLAFFNGGRELQRVWLKATQLNLIIQPVAPLCYLFPRINNDKKESMSQNSFSELKTLKSKLHALCNFKKETCSIMYFKIAPKTDKKATRSLRVPTINTILNEKTLTKAQNNHV